MLRGRRGRRQGVAPAAWVALAVAKSPKTAPAGRVLGEDAAVGSPDPLASPGSPRGRRAVGVGALVWLLIQIAVPAAYYVGLSSDERFRWRMFSTRFHAPESCTIAVHEQGPLDEGAPSPARMELHRLLSAVSVRALGRHPERLGEALLRRWCRDATGARSVRLARVCHREGAGAVPAGEMMLDCATGALSSSGLQR